MKVVSWNIHRCFGMDRRYRPDRIADALNAIQADVISLQEVDSSLRAGSGEDQLSYIAGAVGMKFVIGATLNFDYGAYGNAILTRFPIVEYEEYDLSYRRFEPRGALAVTVSHPSIGRVRVVNTHLGLKHWERVFQIGKLLSHRVFQGPEPVVLTGDFNEWFPYTGNRYRLEKAFKEMSPRVPTFPAAWPKLCLDRIFLSGPVKEFSHEVPRTPLTRVASDHLPVVGQIEFESIVQQMPAVL